jgi:hypothetical protein
MLSEKGSCHRNVDGCLRLTFETERIVTEISTLVSCTVLEYQPIRVEDHRRAY